MTEEQYSILPQNPYIYGNVRDITLCPEADANIQATPLSSSWNGISDEKSPSRSRRRRRDTTTQIRPLSELNQAILKVHSSLSHKLERLGPIELNEASSEVFMMKLLNWLRIRFVRDPIALSYIDGDLTTRSLSLQWSLESDADDQLLDDLLKVGFPDLTSGVSARSPAIVVSPIYYENYQSTDALHILPLGKVFGSSQPMNIETYWGKVSCKRVDQTEYPETRNLIGLPPALDSIKEPLLWTYNQIQSEPKDRVERCFSAQSRYQEVEKGKQGYFRFNKGDFDRNPQDPVIARACTWLRSRIAYFAYDLALFTGNPPHLDPVGGGWPEVVKLRTMYECLRNDLDSYLNSSESRNLIEPMRIAEAKEFAELNLSDLVNANITNSLNDVVREFVLDFSKDYPDVLTENSVFEIDTVDVPVPSEAWLAGEYAYLANPSLFGDSKKRMSLADMLMQKIPAGPWRHVRNGQAASAVPDEHRRAIKERITRARYDMDTEIPFRFQQLLDSKRDYFSRVFDTSLSLHAHEFIHGPNPSHQKALVKEFLAGKKPAYKCAFDGYTVFGTVFIPYQVDDTSSPWRANLNKNGLLYSPFNGFVWLEGYQFSKAQYAAIRNGLLPEGKSALDATKNVGGLSNKGVIHPGLPGMGGMIYSDLPRIPTGPILDFDVRVGGEEVKSGNLSRYLVNSISEYYDKVFDLQHLSLQEQWDEIRDHLMLAVSILNIVAIPFPYLGLALIAGNMTIAIVTLTDPRSSGGDKAWAIADLLLEPLGGVGDVITLSRSAMRTLGSLPSASRGIETSEYMKKLAGLAQDALQAKRGVNHKLEGVIRRIGRRGTHANFTSGTSLPNSKSSGLCRGLALKDAISRLNDSPIDNLPKELSKNQLIADDVRRLHGTQPIVTDRSLVLSSDEARLATRRAIEDPSRGSNFVALDEEMTFSQAKKELLVQLAKHKDVSFVIGTHSHAVSLSKQGSGANAGLTFFDPAKQTRHWPLGEEEKNISEILSHIASRYDSGVSKKVDDHPLLLTVITKKPESRHIYVSQDGIESLKAAVYQLDLDLSQGRLIQPIMVKNSVAKARMQAHLDSLKTSESSLTPLLNKVTIEEIQPSHLASLPAENSAITVIGDPSVSASEIATDLRALPEGYRDVRYLDVRFATNKRSAEVYQIRQARRENIVRFETTGVSTDPCENLAAEMRSAGQSSIQVRDGDLPFPQRRTSDEWRRIGREQRGKAKKLAPMPSELVSDISKLKTFESALTNLPSTRPFVHYPPSARGDMNAFKYIQYLPEEKRPLVVFEYHLTGGPQQARENTNISVFRQHLIDSKLTEGRDYVFADKVTKDKFKAKVKGDGIRKDLHYQVFDNIFSSEKVLKAAQKSLGRMASSDLEIKNYLKTKDIDSGVTNTKYARKNDLIMVNINKRNVVGSDWDPREMRHATDLDVTQKVLKVALSEQVNGKRRINRDICVVGSNFTKLEEDSWRTFAEENRVTIHFLNDMMAQGLDRSQQRAAQYAFADTYRSTTYFGLQSGVNEDAVVLPRTNVISMSEYLGFNQPGIGRVEARTQFDQVDPSEFDPLNPSRLDEHEPRTTNIFYSLRENEFLSTDGILAAVQVKKDLNGTSHKPLEEIWSGIDDAVRSRGEDAIARKMYEIIFDNPVSQNPSPTELLYLDALRVIARRKMGNTELSKPMKERLTNVLKKIMLPHDRRRPLTRRHEIDAARNAGKEPYTVSKTLRNYRGEQEVEEAFKEWLKNADELLESVDLEDLFNMVVF